MLLQVGKIIYALRNLSVPRSNNADITLAFLEISALCTHTFSSVYVL